MKTASRFILVLILLVGVNFAGQTAFAENPNPNMPVSLLSGKWWQWAFSMPVDKHPLNDTADCSEGQSGSVWFLGSAITSEQTGLNEYEAVVSRECEVPAGTSLFVPVLNVECSVLEGYGTSARDLSEAAKFFMDGAGEFSAEIDGVAVENLEGYRTQSRVFNFGPLPENNYLEAPVGARSRGVADGVYLLIKPLPPGEHTIKFSGVFEFNEEEHGFDFKFTSDATYKVIVN